MQVSFKSGSAVATRLSFSMHQSNGNTWWFSLYSLELQALKLKKKKGNKSRKLVVMKKEGGDPRQWWILRSWCEDWSLTHPGVCPNSAKVFIGPSAQRLLSSGHVFFFFWVWRGEWGALIYTLSNHSADLSITLKEPALVWESYRATSGKYLPPLNICNPSLWGNFSNAACWSVPHCISLFLSRFLRTGSR